MNQVDILLVEDNEADVVLVREALKDAKVYNSLHVAKDGDEAVAFLEGDAALNPEKLRPGLIMLDLYLPKRSGLDVLKYIKGSQELKLIPVVVMTSSQEETDIVKAYELQANCYVTKPVDFDQLINVVKTIEGFWLSVVHLPPVQK